MDKAGTSSPLTPGAGSPGQSRPPHTLPLYKTAAEFKAHRLNLREQCRLHNLHAYLSRQERHCRKEFRTSVVKMQNYYTRRLSGADSPCPPPSLSPSPRPTPSPSALSRLSPFPQQGPIPFRRASEIPASPRSLSAAVGTDGEMMMLHGKLQQRRQTYGGSELSHCSPTCGHHCVEVSQGPDCPLCRQMDDMIHLLHLEEDGHQTGIHPDREHQPSQDTFSPFREDISNFQDKGRLRSQPEDLDDAPDRFRSGKVSVAGVCSEGVPVPARSPSGGGKGQQTEVPSITVQDADHARSPRTAGDPSGRVRHARSQDPPSSSADPVHSATRAGRRRSSRLAAIAVSLNQPTVNTTGDRSDDVSSTPGTGEWCDAPTDTDPVSAVSRPAHLTSLQGGRRSSDVSMLPSTSPSPSPADLTSPNRVKMPSSTFTTPKKTTSSSFGAPNRSKTTSAKLATLNRTPKRTANSAPHPRTPIVSSNPRSVNQSPSTRHRPAHLPTRLTHVDVNCDDILQQHVKGRPVDEQESINRRSPIVQDWHTPAGGISSHGGKGSTPLRSHPRTHSAAVLQNSDRNWNSSPRVCQSSGTTRNSVSAGYRSGRPDRTAGSRPLQGRVSEFLQQQTEFNKRFPLKDNEVKSLDCVRPDLSRLSRDQGHQHKPSVSKEKGKMMAEVMDMLGLPGIQTASG